MSLLLNHNVKALAMSEGVSVSYVGRCEIKNKLTVRLTYLRSYTT